MKTLAAQEIVAALAPRVAVSCADPLFVLPAERYFLRKFLPWWRKHLLETGITYRKDRYDCDDYARQFRAQMALSGRDTPGDGAVCCAVLYARNITESLRIPPGSHALNLVGLRSSGDRPRWLVVEPQNSLHVDLAHYHSADQLHAEF